MRNQFTLWDLITIKDGKIQAPFSPSYAAKAAVEEDGDPLHGIIRISFNDQTVNNTYEGKSEKGVKHDLTGYDLLAILTEYNNDKATRLILDMGSQYCPIGIKFASETDITITPIWKSHNEFEIKMSEDDIAEIFKQIESRWTEFSVISKLATYNATA